MRGSIRAEFGFECREMLHQKSRQETIFTEGEQILLVQCVDIGFGVFLDDTVGNDDGTAFVGSSNTIKGETTRQTGDRSEQTFKGLGQMMRNIVLVDLDHGPPGVFLVGKLGFTAYTNDLGVVSAGGHKAIEGIRGDGLRMQDEL